MASYDTSKRGLDAMNDVQFNASMDALLESENFDGSGGSESFRPNENVQTSAGMGTSSAEGPRQGLLTTPPSLDTSTESMVYSLPHVPYAVAANNAAPLPSSMQNFMGSSYPAMEPSAQGLNQGQLPIMPAPVNSAPIAQQTPSKQPPKTIRSTARRRSSTSSKRSRDASAVSEDEEERQRRRQDRNAREQQRSHRITEQIDHLKEVLGAANIPFKPDKFSTLVTVSEYIKQLQAKSAMLDAEHKKLIDTIARTNDMVNDPSGASAQREMDGTIARAGQDQGQPSEGNIHSFGPNVDYRNVFARCGVPLAVLSIDGRFLDCNHEFERLTGHTREELLPLETLEKTGRSTTSPSEMSSSSLSSSSSGASGNSSQARNLSLFNLLSRNYMEGAFMAMSEMLKHPVEDLPAGSRPKDYWAGIVGLSRHGDMKIRMNISLVRSPEGRAKFFDCALTPMTDTSG